MTTPTAVSWPADNRRNLFQLDVRVMQAEFEKEQERLFVPDDEVNVTIIELKNGQRSKREFTTSGDILAYTAEAREQGTTTIILIHQTFSWGELEISKVALQTLFSHLSLSAGFWPVLKLFGSKDNANHEFGGGFNELRCDEDNSFNFSYTVKHIEEHGRAGAYDPWSIRQIGVYHKYHPARNENVFVLLNPSVPLMGRLNNFAADVEMMDVHQLILCTVTERWSQYLEYLESVCNDISKKAVLSNSPQKLSSRGFAVCFSDSQSIQNLQSTILRVSHMLDLNHSVFKTLLASPQFSLNSASPQNCSGRRSITSGISTLSAQTRGFKCHVENLLRRLEGTSVLVHSILDAQALETLQMSSSTTAELAALAREDAKKATRDARRLNTITILGFVYLPASFVATLLGTQYITIHTDGKGDHRSIDVKREMWIFVILTAILLMVTAGAWFSWERHSRLADRAAAEKLGTA